MSAAVGAAADLAQRLAAALGLDEPGPAEDLTGTVCLDVPAGRWHDAARWARDELALDFFDWLSAVDEPDHAAVDVVLHLVQSRSGGDGIGRSGGLVRLVLRTRLAATPDGPVPAVASVTDLWAGAAWHERETHEMFGVGFTGFSDAVRGGPDHGLRPLLLPDGFEGTPLRKSFVLAARASKPWPGAKEPGESDEGGHRSSPGRRKLLPPGVPDATWGPRPPGGGAEPAEPGEAAEEAEDA